MKKIFAIIISLALLSTASVTAFAASPITAKDGSDSAVVKGTYVAGDASATVYSVDIAWGSMDLLIQTLQKEHGIRIRTAMTVPRLLHGVARQTQTKSKSQIILMPM